MKAVISSTYDDKYLYFLPIVTWCWNKLGVDVICFVPDLYLDGANLEEEAKLDLINNICKEQGLKISYNTFSAPEHKEATYAQCSRLYGACLDLPEDEVLVLGDVDMAVFMNPVAVFGDRTDELFKIFGVDLVPEGQYPICYISAPVKKWREAFNMQGKTYQILLDDLLGSIECENMRGNYWSKDQQEAHDNISVYNEIKVGLKRAKAGTQFAEFRVDRDDTNWRSYVNEELIDAHLWRPGYTDENHANIMELMRMKFPDEDFTWIDNYRNAYKQLL